MSHIHTSILLCMFSFFPKWIYFTTILRSAPFSPPLHFVTTGPWRNEDTSAAGDKGTTLSNALRSRCCFVITFFLPQAYEQKKNIAAPHSLRLPADTKVIHTFLSFPPGDRKHQEKHLKGKRGHNYGNTHNKDSNLLLPISPRIVNKLKEQTWLFILVTFLPNK